MKRFLIVTVWCLAIAAVSAPPLAAAADHFARRFALELDSSAAYYSIRLPVAVYAASRRSDLGDVRVFNGAGEPVPYSLDASREAARTPPTLRTVRWFPLPATEAGSAGAPLGVTIAADGSLRTTAAPPTRAQHDTDLVDVGRVAGEAGALVVHLRNDNYQGRVTVESSNDLRNWQPAGDAQLLKVTYNGSTLSQDRIALDGLRARYVRLRWLDGAPYIESIELEVEAANSDRAQRADTQREWREGIVARAGPTAGEYFFDTGGPYPVDRLRLNLPQPNTVAPAVVYSRTGLQAPWREVSNATLYRLHNGAVEQSNPSIEVAADTDRQWRVVVDARNGGLGSGVLTVAAGWRPATLTFVARGAAPFTLAVGNEAAVSSAVSREELLMGASSVAVAARLGATLPVAPQDADAQSANEDRDAMRRYVLWAALLLAVSSLGMIAWRLARGARTTVDVAGARAGTEAGHHVAGTTAGTEASVATGSATGTEASAAAGSAAGTEASAATATTAGVVANNTGSADGTGQSSDRA